MSWIAIAALALGSYLLKAAGPLLLSERVRPALHRLGVLITPALLAALIAVQTFGQRKALVLDARSVGLAVAIAAVLLRAPFVVVLVSAAGATALVRAIS
ncbi:MAG TPA: AzlD domain-containing protein [Actinomycetota bacterium]|nr:AzlD domain-containing protein [Actinomycetota bacterium]